MASLWEKLRDQEMVDIRLLLVLPLLALVGIGVWFFVGGSGSTSGRDAPGVNDLVYTCHFDQTERVVNGEELWKLEQEGDALINRGGVIPTRVRCPKCDRMSCFTPQIPSGEPVAVDESWDLSENAQPEAAGRGGRGGRVRGR